jgi:hypothetical protein
VDAEVDDSRPASAFVELGEFLPGSGKADLKSFDFAEPAFAVGFAIRASRLSRISSRRCRCAGSGTGVGKIPGDTLPRISRMRSSPQRRPFSQVKLGPLIRLVL